MNYLEIEKVIGREILDSRGNPTVEAEVTLECRNELAGVVIDRFGHGVWMCPHGEDHFRARVSVAVSSQFFGWITGIGFGMRIVGPEDVRQQYKEYLQSVIQNYMD